MKIKVITRDWKGSYCKEDLADIKGMICQGGEDDVDTQGDMYAMVFTDQQTDESAQELYNLFMDFVSVYEDEYRYYDDVGITIGGRQCFLVEKEKYGPTLIEVVDRDA